MVGYSELSIKIRFPRSSWENSRKPRLCSESKIDLKVSYKILRHLAFRVRSRIAAARRS
jgi:hypothetical protein